MLAAVYTGLPVAPMLPLLEPAVIVTVEAVNTSLELLSVILPVVELLPLVASVIVFPDALMLPAIAMFSPLAVRFTA